MIKGKLILKGSIELLSPTIIGSGMDENSDLDVMKDSEGKPFIPATSFLGVLRHKTNSIVPDREKFEYFWGTSSSVFESSQNQRQSCIACSDLLPEKTPTLSIRDGVKINNKKGIAEENAKFDYEIIERGNIFNLNVEITLDGKDDEFKKQMLATIIELIKNKEIRIGAKTTSGFGKITLKDWKVYDFDFSKGENVIHWFRYLTEGILPQPCDFKYNAFGKSKNQFVIDALFTIKNSLIVRSYSVAPDLPDTEHIKSGDDPVLPGTSLKGAIRARAERIIKTLEKPEKIITELFGSAGKDVENPVKGRVIVEESLLKDFPSEVQTRIKIDRFTGGTIESALVETKPLFRGKEESLFEIKLTVENYQPHEAGLLLLVLKDLWTGDLPIGGEKAIGRGVLKGKSAEITYNGKTYRINEDLSIFPEDGIRELQELVNALNQKSVSAEEVCHE